MKIFESSSTYLEVNILNRSNPDSNDKWDGNWLDAKIEISVLGFRGLYGTNLRVEDFHYFHESLLRLKNRELNEVEFKTLEEGIYLKGSIEETGNITWEGKAISDPKCFLKFIIKSDSNSVEKLISDTEMLIEQYPLKV